MKILEPIKIKSLELENRLVVGAMASALATETGEPTEKFLKYYETKAKGHWGLIITEDYVIDYQGGASVFLPGLYNDDLIEKHKELTDRVHRAGSKIACQIYLAGRVALNSQLTGKQVIAPSAVKDPTGKELPHELTIEEIHELIEKFGDAALRVKKAGFDAVEIHGASGYLIGQFVSPFSNKRTDEYGGTTRGRAKFAIDIVKNVRAKVGEDYPILYRMAVDEKVYSGLEVEEAKAIAIMLEEAGIDAIHCNQGVVSSHKYLIPSYVVNKGSLINNAAEIKKVVSIPVIGVGGHVNDPYVAEEILRSGKADMVTMARASLADPELPNKVKEGRMDEICQCIGCMQGCASPTKNIDGLRCLMNPMLGKESEYVIEPVSDKKKVYIAGGGISGCEVAIVAARRGHEVTVFEKDDHLGGQWCAAAVPYGKADFGGLVSWQKQEMQKHGVKIELNTAVTKEKVAEEKPDILVVATGNIPSMPPIKGLKESGAVFANDVLLGKCTVGQNVVIIGGGSVGAETAEFLAIDGRKVTIVEMLPEIAKDTIGVPRVVLLETLNKYGVRMYTSSSVQEVTDGQVTLVQNGETIVLDQVDTVIVAAGARKNDVLVQDLAEQDYCQVIAVGDSAQVKNGYRNLQEAFEVGLKI